MGGNGKPVDKSIPKNTKITIDVPSIDIFVRYAFYNAGKGECLSPGEGITGISFEVDDKPVGKKTVGYGANGRISTGVAMKVARAAELGHAPSKEVGWTKLPLTDVSDGDHKLKVIPPDGRASSGRADPALMNTAK